MSDLLRKHQAMIDAWYDNWQREQREIANRPKPKRNRKIEAREQFALRLAMTMFGGGYDDNIGLAKSAARNEKLWSKRP